MEKGRRAWRLTIGRPCFLNIGCQLSAAGGTFGNFGGMAQCGRERWCGSVGAAEKVFAAIGPIRAGRGATGLSRARSLGMGWGWKGRGESSNDGPWNGPTQVL